MNSCNYGPTLAETKQAMPPAPGVPVGWDSPYGVTNPNAVGDVIAAQNAAWKAQSQGFFNSLTSQISANQTTDSSNSLVQAIPWYVWVLGGVAAVVAIKVL
jgi:hypothetical protein